MTPSSCLLDIKRGRRLKAGGLIVFSMDLYAITPQPQSGLFLEKFRLSWIAFDPEDPSKRVLFDRHPPIGLHYHVDDGEQTQVTGCKTVGEILLLFEQKVIERFGELEDRIYEDFHL